MGSQNLWSSVNDFFHLARGFQGSSVMLHDQFFISSYDSIIFHYMDGPKFNRLFTDGFKGCFHLLTMVTNAVANVCVQVFVYVFIFLGYRSRTVIAGSGGDSPLITYRAARLTSKVAAPFYIPICSVQGFLTFSTPPSTLVIVWLFTFTSRQRGGQCLGPGRHRASPAHCKQKSPISWIVRGCRTWVGRAWVWESGRQKLSPSPATFQLLIALGKSPKLADLLVLLSVIQRTKPHRVKGTWRSKMHQRVASDCLASSRFSIKGYPSLLKILDVASTPLPAIPSQPASHRSCLNTSGVFRPHCITGFWSLGQYTLDAYTTLGPITSIINKTRGAEGKKKHIYRSDEEHATLFIKGYLEQKHVFLIPKSREPTVPSSFILCKRRKVCRFTANCWAWPALRADSLFS